MKLKLIAGAALLAAAVLPASAQQSGSPQQGSAAQQSGTQQGSAAQQSAGAQQGQGDRAMAMTQDKVRQQLQQAGFKEVQIVDAAYLVQARTQDGTPVVMMINPPSMANAAATNPPTGATGSTGATGGAASGSNPPK